MTTATDLINENNGKINELNKQNKLMNKYLDMKVEIDRWGKHRFYSPSVNAATTEVHIHHSCGCCADAVVYARPYLVEDGIKIYSDPPRFLVGEGNPYYTDDGGPYHEYDAPYDNWEDEMRQAYIPESLIEQVRQYFKEQQEKHENLY